MLGLELIDILFVFSLKSTCFFLRRSLLGRVMYSFSFGDSKDVIEGWVGKSGFLVRFSGFQEYFSRVLSLGFEPLSLIVDTLSIGTVFNFLF